MQPVNHTFTTATTTDCCIHLKEPHSQTCSLHYSLLKAFKFSNETFFILLTYMDQKKSLQEF